jgi:hypothetical protein
MKNTWIYVFFSPQRPTRGHINICSEQTEPKFNILVKETLELMRENILCALSFPGKSCLLHFTQEA